MHRKHYTAIVGIINNYTDDNEPGTLHEERKFEAMINELADMFQSDNPNFNRGKFFSAIKYFDNVL
jgi:hypothetical protein